MNYKNIIIFTITLILIFSTTLIKNKTKDLEEKIYLTRESISKKKSEYQIMLLEYNYLTSPEKLMEYHRLYFDDNLVPLKIDDLKQIELNKNAFEIKKLGKFLQNDWISNNMDVSQKDNNNILSPEKCKFS